MSIRYKSILISPPPREVLERLKDTFGVKTQVQLASRLAIKPQAIISAIRRGEIPEAWLYKSAYETQASLLWLKRGIGRKFLRDRIAEASAERGVSIPPAADRLLKVWSELAGPEKIILNSCAEVLRFGDEEVKIVLKVLSALERHIEYKRQKAQRLKNRSRSSRGTQKR